MPVQITIIGLGQIGTSIGLVLAGRKDLARVTGHDKDTSAAQRAHKLGAVEQIHFNLPASVANADLVLLALPIGEIRDTLKYIAQDLREDVVVMDTAPVKAPVMKWVKEFLPERRYYIGLLPVTNPAYLFESKGGQEAAHADLFQKGLMGIVSPPGTPGDAIKLASDFTRVLGADPFYLDPTEADSLMSSVHLLPQMVAGALINATVDQPGWMEARKLAGHAYAGTTGAALYQDTIAGLRDAAMLNKENTLRVLERMIGQLTYIRDNINKGNEEQLEEVFNRAVDGIGEWQNQREKGEWLSAEIKKSEMPSPGEFFKKFFFGRWGDRPKKQ
jgi:prephenate dehydrogenase